MLVWGHRARFAHLSSEAELGRGVWMVLWLIWVSLTGARHQSEGMLQVSSATDVRWGVVWGIGTHQQVGKVVLHRLCCNCLQAECYELSRFS